MKEKLFAKTDILLQRKQDRELTQLLSHQDFHEIAQVIDALSHGKRKTFALLPPEKQAEVALALSENSQKMVFPRLSDEIIARFMHFNDEDDATDILQFLSPSRRTLILLKMKEDKRRKIEKLLHFGSETAGGLMDFNFILVRPEYTQKEVMEKIQRHVDMQKQIPTVIVADDKGELLGFIPHRILMFTNTPGANISEKSLAIPTVSYKTDREQVVQLISRQRADVVAVVDEKNTVLGVIRLTDLLRVAQDEATEDIYRFAGVDVEEHALDSVLAKVKRRYSWLIINLGTAFMASFVVSLFQDVITQAAILAVYMPIVAGQGGNAATQALVVVVRGLALGEISWSRAKRVVIKEALTGTVNGLITGMLAALVAVALGAPPVLGFILMAAMIINMFVAGFFGALIPFVLKRMKIDPATASAVFVTTTTDICGFFVFLGLGAMFLIK